MRRWVKILAVAALLTGAGPATAQATAEPDSPWVPVPVDPFERAAGVVCDFAVRGVPIEADLRKRTLSTNPDGSVRSELWVGPLVYAVSNESTGATTTLDASSSAVIVYRSDGSLRYYLTGPLGLAVAAGRSNLDRGLWQLDGRAWTLDISATGFETVSRKGVSAENICERID